MGHTPGPWAYDADSKEVFASAEQYGCGWIALVEGNDSDDQPLAAEMQAANASLIAAAPELLAAIKVLVAECERLPADVRYTIDCSEAMLAIDKAEGRTA